MSEHKKPKVSSDYAQTELDKAEKQFDQFDQSVKDMTMDRMNMAPKEQAEPQTKMSTREAQNSKDVYLKPKRSIASKDKFNENFRQKYEFDKQFVKFIAENKEIIGETIDIWTRPYGGMPAEEWEVPCNKPVWGPRYLAEQIKRKFYHRLVMQNIPTEANGMGTMYGTMAVDTTVPRLDAHPVSDRKSIFMGNTSFG